MIDYKKAKKFLIPTLLDYGFRERRDKSCRSCRVFSNGSEVLLVKSSAQGEYDHYQNKTESGDYGDTVQFLMKHKLNKSYNLSAEEFCVIENELERIGGLTTVNNIINNTFIEVAQLPFDIAKYHVERLELDPIPSAIGRFFEQRNLDVEKLAPFKTSIGVLISDKGFKQPLFYWQNINEQVVGAQYKYIKAGNCEKRFLLHTDRNNSLWMTPTEERCGLFVTEDPLDAIAHYQLFPASNFAYVCTGGTSTKNQRTMIHTLAEKYKLPIILGNDNDLAGQIENYKLCHPDQILEYAVNKQDQRVKLRMEDGSEVVWSKENLVKAMQAAKDNAIKICVPQNKDWNDDVREQQKTLTVETKTETSMSKQAQNSGRGLINQML